MSKDEVQTKKVLISLLKEAYENYLDYSRFHLFIVPKELKSKHGQYKVKEARIEVFNLTRKPEHTFLTCLHELAHHIEQVDYGITAHEESFYEIYHHLLIYAFAMKLLKPEDILNENDSSDCASLIAYFDSPEDWELPVVQLDEHSVITVSKGYEQRRFLKQIGYTWFSISQTWQKECDTEEMLQQELLLLEKQVSQEQIRVQRNQQLSFFAYYYIAVLNGYDYRKELRERGYLWEAYGRQKEWVKKVEVSQYYEEIRNLGELAGVHYKKVTPDFHRMEREHRKQEKVRKKQEYQRFREQQKQNNRISFM